MTAAAWCLCRFISAVTKWEKQNTENFRDFAGVFDGSQRGSLSYNEFLDMLREMKTCTKLTDGDDAFILQG